ncbi:MAG: tRNA modification GTPase TrmE [Gracilibacter sp. BRH_c7a]|nr:MAG: tRNA modification GTPase TrmE [Gracilibacter sp. BRH_c7a]
MNDTIVALATPLGEGAIHIVRLSGKEANRIINVCFKPRNIQRWQEEKNFTLHLGWFYAGQSIKLDQVLVSKMTAPFSFTGEDVFEINCHGGVLTARRIIDACIQQGARLAEAGEFSKRAFLNGKMDLVQAEAVIDLITSRTSMSADLALQQLGGGLSSKINELRQQILDILSYIEARIDFPEDEIDELAFREISLMITKAREKALDIYKGSKTGKVIREGLSTVIAGRPNVGKSSLLNALVKEERAIVTDIPGTTRDELHEYIKIGEILLHLIDTAGIRESHNLVEMLGIERTWKALSQADIVLLLIDANELKQNNIFAEEMRILEEYSKKTIVLINKVDIFPEYRVAEINNFNNIVVIPFSVKEGIGFAELEQEINRRVFEGEAVIPDQPLLSNIRQIHAIENSILSLEKAKEGIINNLPFDILSIDIRAALEEISSITGHQVQEELLNNIFSRFCIGK